MEFTFLGYEIKRAKETKDDNLEQIAIPDERDGAHVMRSGAGRFIENLDLGSVSTTEIELISAYRRTALIPEVSTAITDIINEMVVVDGVTSVVSLDTSKLKEEHTDKIIKQIDDEFERVVELLKLNQQAYNLAHDWYVDGKIVFHKIIDSTKTKDGIVRLTQIDPKKIRKVIEVEDKGNSTKILDTYYVYTENPEGFADKEAFGSNTLSFTRNQADAFVAQTKCLKIKKDAICFVTSGLYDKSSNISFGHLHKAVRVANQLTMLEDAMIVYRIARATERRIFYVDVGNMNAKSAHAYIENVKREYRNSVNYDTVRGDIKDKNRVMALQEDIFIQRKGGSNATEIDTLDGGQNLGEVDDLLLFRDKLYNALNVPSSRFKEDGGALFGTSTEISREELKFNTFVIRLRAQFNSVFLDILETQLLLKGIIGPNDWPGIKSALLFKYNENGYFAKLKELEILESKLAAVESIKPYIGSYFSHDFVRRNVLGQTNSEIEEEDKRIAEEAKSDQYAKPEDDGY